MTREAHSSANVSERTVDTHTDAFEPNINESEYLNKKLVGPYQAVVVSAGEVELYASDGASPFEPQRVASVSKLITTTAVFRLVEDGRLSLESPISDHLPFSIDDRWVDVTILDLLQQHSGLHEQVLLVRRPMETKLQREALEGSRWLVDIDTEPQFLCVVTHHRTGDQQVILRCCRRHGIHASMTSPVLDETYQHLAGAGAFAVSAIDLALLMAALQDHSLTAPNFLTTASKNLMRSRNVWNYGTGTWVFDNGSWGHSGTLSEGRNIVVELVDGG